MATSGFSSTSPIASTLFLRKIRREFLLQNKLSFIGENQKPLSRSIAWVNFQIDSRLSPVTSISRRSLTARAASSDEYLEECETLPSLEENPLKFGFLVLIWASISLAWFAASADANAAADSIRASSFGLNMPFWSAFSANFFSVVLAELLVNLLVNLGLKSAVITGIGLFCVSTFMWSFLRSIRKSLSF